MGAFKVWVLVDKLVQGRDLYINIIIVSVNCLNLIRMFIMA